MLPNHIKDLLGLKNVIITKTVHADNLPSPISTSDKTACNLMFLYNDDLRLDKFY